MDTDKVDEIKAQIILDELEAKQKVEEIAKETENEYYFGTFRKSASFLASIIIYVVICLKFDVGDDKMFVIAFIVFTINESRRMSNKIDALVKLQEIYNNKK